MNLPKYPKYDSYKDSGVEWIGEVPEKWIVDQGRACIYENKNKNTGMKENTVLSLSYGNVIVKPIEKLTGLVPESFETYQIVEPDDIIIRGTDLQNDVTSLRTGLAKNRGIITSAYINLRPFDNVIATYLHYVLHSYDKQKVFYGLGSGLRQNLSYFDFKYLNLPIPDLETQEAIAEFLDDKTVKIDDLVRIKNEQIKLLKERKQIIIQEAVTKGLDPNAPMKDSGIKWIGQIPSHWDHLANKFIFKLKKDTVGKQAIEYDLLSLTLRGIIKRDMENPEGKFPAEFDSYQEVCIDDFVFCHFDVEETPRTIGLSKIHGMITGAYTVYTADDCFSREYLSYFYLFADNNKKLRSLYKGLRNTIKKDVFGSFKTPIPPFVEQLAIVEHIEMQSKEIDAAIALKHDQIAKLKEYKSTLINAAVTGKIKVS